MQSEFRFTRHGCKPTYDVTIRLVAESSAEFSVACNSNIFPALSDPQIAAITLGIRSAYSAAAPQAAISIEVLEATDHSGTTGDLGFKICGEAALNCLIGMPEKAPFPGYVLGDA